MGVCGVLYIWVWEVKVLGGFLGNPRIFEEKKGSRRGAEAQRKQSNILLRALYVQKARYRFYFHSSCSRDDERSEESCEHDDRPKTGRASALQGRRRAWFKPISCLAARTAD